eukprot:750634-Hanusia_phi.AAC.3
MGAKRKVQNGMSTAALGVRGGIIVQSPLVLNRSVPSVRLLPESTLPSNLRRVKSERSKTEGERFCRRKQPRRLKDQIEESLAKVAEPPPQKRHKVGSCKGDGRRRRRGRRIGGGGEGGRSSSCAGREAQEEERRKTCQSDQRKICHDGANEAGGRRSAKLNGLSSSPPGQSHAVRRAGRGSFWRDRRDHGNQRVLLCLALSALVSSSLLGLGSLGKLAHSGKLRIQKKEVRDRLRGREGGPWVRGGGGKEGDSGGPGQASQPEGEGEERVDVSREGADPRSCVLRRHELNHGYGRN